MATLLSIGDFARMTYLTVKALRHYHEVGLLTPAMIDPASGYRRYDSSQVATAQVIRRLRELGMPLEELKVVLNAADVSTRNAAIIAHLQRMERELQRTQATVASLRNLLEHAPTPITVEYRAAPASATLAIRGNVTFDEIADWRETAAMELRSALVTLRARRAGADAALYSNELLENGHGEIIAFIPVHSRARPSGRIEDLVLPATEYAVTMHHGSFDRIDQTYGALGTFVAERAIGVHGPILENYLIGMVDTPDESQHRTEVCWPIFQTRTEHNP